MLVRLQSGRTGSRIVLIVLPASSHPFVADRWRMKMRRCSMKWMEEDEVGSRSERRSQSAGAWQCQEIEADDRSFREHLPMTKTITLSSTSANTMGVRREGMSCYAASLGAQVMHTHIVHASQSMAQQLELLLAIYPCSGFSQTLDL